MALPLLISREMGALRRFVIFGIIVMSWALATWTESAVATGFGIGPCASAFTLGCGSLGQITDPLQWMRFNVPLYAMQGVDPYYAMFNRTYPLVTPGQWGMPWQSYPYAGPALYGGMMGKGTPGFGAPAPIGQPFAASLY